MASKYWIKLYIEVLDDPKMGKMPDFLWRRAIELFLLAGENGNDGLLQPVPDMAWRLRVDEDRLRENLRALAESGVVHETPAGWVVTHFGKRQAVETNAERQNRFRSHARRTQITGSNNAMGNAERNELVTQTVTNSVLDIEVDKDKEIDRDKEVEVEGKNNYDYDSSKKYPKTPLEAAKNLDVCIFKAVTGRIGGPGQYQTIIDSVRLIREQKPDLLDMVGYLRPYFQAWRSRKNGNGRPYDVNGLAWLTEWAVHGEIPPLPKRDTEKVTEEQDREKYFKGADFVEH